MIPHIPVLPRVDSLSCARCRISMPVMLMNSQVPISGDISARFLQVFKSISKPLALSIICSMVPWYHSKLYNFLSLLLRVSPYVISKHTSPVFFYFNPSISPWLCQIICLASQIWQGSSCGLPYLVCHLTRKAERMQHRSAPLWGHATQVCRELLAYRLAPCSCHIQTRLRTVHAANSRSAQKAGCYQPITRKDWGWSAPVYFSACLPIWQIVIFQLYTHWPCVARNMTCRQRSWTTSSCDRSLGSQTHPINACQVLRTAQIMMKGGYWHRRSTSLLRTNMNMRPLKKVRQIEWWLVEM